MSKRFKPVLALILSVFMSVSTLSNTYTVFAEEETTVQTDEQTNEEKSIETSDSSNEDNSQNLAEDVNESDDQLDKNTDEINKEENSIEITATVKIVDKTGVEMEALTAATVSALTIYDMCKAVDKRMVIESTHLLKKTGGKSGEFNF